jgi:hypothetical protein
MRIGRFEVLVNEATKRISARAFGNVESEGDATTYEVSGRGIRLTVADVAWDTGQRDVRALDVSTGATKVGRLLKGGRFGIYEANFESYPLDVAYFELGVMKTWTKKGKLPSVVRASYSKLVEGSGGLDVWLKLSDAGASSIGPKAELFGDDSTRRNWLAVTFPSGSRVVPIVAYVLSRVIPLATGYAG